MCFFFVCFFNFIFDGGIYWFGFFFEGVHRFQVAYIRICTSLYLVQLSCPAVNC